MKHLREDELLLYHYGEIRTAPAERHLSVCRICRSRLDEFARDVGNPSARPPKGLPPLPSWRRLLLLFVPAAGSRRG